MNSSFGTSRPMENTNSGPMNIIKSMIRCEIVFVQNNFLEQLYLSLSTIIRLQDEQIIAFFYCCKVIFFI